MDSPCRSRKTTLLQARGVAVDLERRKVLRSYYDDLAGHVRRSGDGKSIG